MLERIVSGGQTGVDRATLDAALDAGLSCGGWCPKGRLAEDGHIPLRYPLIETPSDQYEERTEWNVRDSSGTLILAWGRPTGGTAYTIEVALRHNKPCLVVDLSAAPVPEAIASWTEEHRIRVLNVAGPRASASPSIYLIAYRCVSDLIELLKRRGASFQ